MSNFNLLGVEFHFKTDFICIIVSLYIEYIYTKTLCQANPELSKITILT